MTVDTTPNIKTYTGNGVTAPYSTEFKFYDDTDIVVTVSGSTKTLNGAGTYDYTVSGGGGLVGTVTFNNAPLSSAPIILQRIVPIEQQTDFQNFDGNPADVTERQFDLGIMISQQLNEANARSILAPVGTTLTTNEISGTIDATSRILTITSSGPATATIASLSTTLDTSLTSLTTGDFLQYDGAEWVNIPDPTGIKVSSNDTASGDLEAKLLVGTGLALSTQNDGSNETRTISHSFASQAEVRAGTDNTKPITSLRAEEALYRPVNAIGSIGGGTQDIDLDDGRTVSATVDTSTTTFTFSNPKASGIADAFDLYLTNGGSQTVNWPASVVWAGGAAPSLTSSGIDHLTFSTINAGTTWYGSARILDAS
jgi:hypothetical protein